MKICLVTNAIYDPVPEYVQYTNALKQLYCDSWGIEYLFTSENPLPHLHPQWCKTTFMLKALEEYDWAVWIDCDAATVGTKKGAGTLTLSAAPLYTGTTRVEDGKLVVDGELPGSVVIVVDDPAAAMEAGTWYIAAGSMRRPKLVSTAPDADKYKFVRSTTIIGDKTYTCFKVGEALPPLVLILQ